MVGLFRDIPTATVNSVELSSRLGFTPGDLGYQFALYPVPKARRWTAFFASGRRKVSSEGMGQKTILV
jgi:error-prone DNA polymerase